MLKGQKNYAGKGTSHTPKIIKSHAQKHYSLQGKKEQSSDWLYTAYTRSDNPRPELYSQVDKQIYFYAED